MTGLLVAWNEGDPAALDELMPAMYSELRRLARAALRRERPDHSLQATALVNEAYLRLVDQRRVDWRGRANFLSAASTIMRRILVDHARKRAAAKRGAGVTRVILDEELAAAAERNVDVVALDAALESLATLDPRQGRLVELRFFGGLTIEEVAEVLQVSATTVKREWRSARMWLRRELAAT